MQICNKWVARGIICYYCDSVVNTDKLVHLGLIGRLRSYIWCSVLSKAYKQTLIITGSDSITRHSLYWESPQFSLFVSYHGPLTWPHLPKTYFPISVPNIIYLCHHLIVYVSFKNFCNCFTAIIMLLSFFCACNMPILCIIKSSEHWYLKSTNTGRKYGLKNVFVLSI